jgi:hypothetical protein
MLRRRQHGRFQEEAFEDNQNLGQRYRTDGSHRCQLGHHCEHPVGLPECPRRERTESVEPLVPISGSGKTVELINEREGVSGEGREVLERPR